MPHETMLKASGTIEDVFAHRFVLKTADKKILADLTPKGAKQFTLKAGERISIEGEQKPSEVKVHRLTQGDRVVEIHHDEKPGHGPHHHDPKVALRAVKFEGFEAIGHPRSKPKHFEVLARRDGKLFELHVELDGHIRKTKAVARHDEKWAADLA